MTSTITSSMSLTVWGALILLSVLWGGSFFFVEVALVDFPPLTLVALRVGVAAMTLWSIVFILGLKSPKELKVWLAFLGMGLLNNVVPFVLIVWGQTQVASGLASILNAATPIFTLVVASLLLPDEKAAPMKLVGVLIGFIGVVIMIGLPALSDSSNLLAQLAIVTATLSYAFAGVYGRRFKPLSISPIMIAAGQVTASALVLIPIPFVFDGPLNLGAIGLTSGLAIVGLAVLSTALAYVLYFKILAIAGATNLLLVTLLIPVSAILLGYLFLNESLDWIHFVGMRLIALGLSVIDGRLWQKYLKDYCLR
ncbi:MAG: DMT family transporter [Marinomonas sp.]